MSEDIPSRRSSILASMEGQIITRMVRLSWYSPQQAARDLRIPTVHVFRLTAGPLAVTLESGRTLGFASQPELASVTVWVAGDIDDDEDISPISAEDPTYSDVREYIGQRVTSLAILKRTPVNVLFEGLPREAGLLIAVDERPPLILSHGLHDDSDSFAIAFWPEIPAPIRTQLVELPIYG